MKNNKIQKNTAFTLIELMVATTIFSMIMLMGVGALVASSNTAKSAQKLRIAVDNVNFAMESMTREIRTGTNYYCSFDEGSLNGTEKQDCVGGDVLVFTPQQVTGAVSRVAYKLGYKKSGNAYGWERNKKDVVYSLVRCDSNGCSDIVSSNVDIQSLKFYVKGSGFDNIQPSIQIITKGVVNIGGVETPFVLQSMASQRSVEK